MGLWIRISGLAMALAYLWNDAGMVAKRLSCKDGHWRGHMLFAHFVRRTLMSVAGRSTMLVVLESSCWLGSASIVTTLVPSKVICFVPLQRRILSRPHRFAQSFVRNTLVVAVEWSYRLPHQAPADHLSGPSTMREWGTCQLLSGWL